MSTTKDRLFLFDTTLRDGQQTPGIDFSLEDKIKIANILDDLGIDYIEGGYPGANPTDTEFFSQERTASATFTAFGMTKRAGVSASNDPGLTAILASKTAAACFVAKSWDYHVKVALGITNEQNLASIRETVETCIAVGKEPLIDCEHFFDGYKANKEFAIACAKTAYDAGARWVVLCDTNGGTLPEEIADIIQDVTQHIPSDHLGIHAHNDTGNAIANSLAAVRAGVRHVQGTLNGIGERCGNANLVALIPTLKLKAPYKDTLTLNISDAQLANITNISRAFDELVNQSANRQAPYVGSSAFATKAGIHASAIVKEPETYEHIPPEKVGNARNIMVSDQAGKSNLLSALARMGLDVKKDDPRLTDLLADIKDRENRGYSYESATASLEILARRRLDSIKDFFKVESFRVGVERRFNALGELVTISEAVVKLDVDGKTFHSVAEGNGPVNALDLALRKDLGKYQSQIKDLELTDFKVRILNGGTTAVTRVLIESADKSGESWTTLGVSTNIIDASFAALLDSINYKLLKSQQ